MLTEEYDGQNDYTSHKIKDLSSMLILERCVADSSYAVHTLIRFVLVKSTTSDLLLFKGGSEPTKTGVAAPPDVQGDLSRGSFKISKRKDERLSSQQGWS